MIISVVDHPMEIKDLAGKMLLPKMDVVHAAREAHIAAEAAAELARASKAAVVQGLAGQMAGAAKAVEFSARSLGCRMHMPVDVSPPHLPLMAAFGADCMRLVVASDRLVKLGEFI